MDSTRLSAGSHQPPVLLVTGRHRLVPVFAITFIIPERKIKATLIAKYPVDIGNTSGAYESGIEKSWITYYPTSSGR
jgi:hypothetical protein